MAGELLSEICDLSIISNHPADFGIFGRDKTNHNNGAFGNYIEVKAALQLKIPESLSFEQAATLGVGIVTCVSDYPTTHGRGIY